MPPNLFNRKAVSRIVFIPRWTGSASFRVSRRPAHAREVTCPEGRAVSRLRMDYDDWMLRTSKTEPGTPRVCMGPRHRGGHAHAR